VLEREDVAWIAAILFSFNPASIFMSSAYTESLFSLFIFSGLYWLWNRSELISSLFFALATTTRSNGVIFLAFILYKRGKEAIEARKGVVVLLIEMAYLLVISLIVISPLYLFESFGYERYCTNGEWREWCGYTVPLLYSFVQSHYWNVGFLKYFEVKQVPNFILASPIVVLSLLAIWKYVKHDFVRFFSLGFITGKGKGKMKDWVENDNLLVFVFHWMAMVFFAVFIMHVQVATRFLCSMCAIFYWFGASIVLERKRHPTLFYFLFFYFYLYFIVGTILFTTFYPWT